MFNEKHSAFLLADFSKEQKAFAQVLANFRFQPIGTDQTENELEIGKCMCIEQYNILYLCVLVSSANSVQMFARLLMTIEDCRRNMVSANIKDPFATLYVIHSSWQCQCEC